MNKYYYFNLPKVIMASFLFLYAYLCFKDEMRVLEIFYSLIAPLILYTAIFYNYKHDYCKKIYNETYKIFVIYYILAEITKYACIYNFNLHNSLLSLFNVPLIMICMIYPEIYMDNKLKKLDSLPLPVNLQEEHIDFFNSESTYHYTYDNTKHLIIIKNNDRTLSVLTGNPQNKILEIIPQNILFCKTIFAFPKEDPQLHLLISLIKAIKDKLMIGSALNQFIL